jgi:hypothetical protein
MVSQPAMSQSVTFQEMVQESTMTNGFSTILRDGATNKHHEFLDDSGVKNYLLVYPYREVEGETCRDFQLVRGNKIAESTACTIDGDRWWVIVK